MLPRPEMNLETVQVSKTTLAEAVEVKHGTPSQDRLEPCLRSPGGHQQIVITGGLNGVGRGQRRRIRLEDTRRRVEDPGQRWPGRGAGARISNGATSWTFTSPEAATSSGPMELSWVGRAYVVVLLVVLPILALIPPPPADQLPPRRALYIWASAFLWALAGITALVLGWEGVGPHEIRLTDGEILTRLFWAAAGTLAGIASSAVLFTFAGRAVGLRESALLLHLMPRTAGDRLAFAGVALTAGFTEEFVYRGVALWGLAGWLGHGPWAAAAITSVAFGILHRYQGLIGILRGAALGFVLAGTVILGGGLPAAMGAHAGVNLILGLSWKRLVGRPEAAAPARSTGEREVPRA